MRKCSTYLLLIAVAIVFVVAPKYSAGHTVYKKPFQKRYDFRSVTCYACHVKGKDENGKPLGKEVLNDLGEDMKELMIDKNVAERLEAVKRADSATRKEVQAAIAVEFVAALEELEKQASPSGEPWEKSLREGTIEGVKLRKK